MVFKMVLSIVFVICIRFYHHSTLWALRHLKEENRVNHALSKYWNKPYHAYASLSNYFWASGGATDNDGWYSCNNERSTFIKPLKWSWKSPFQSHFDGLIKNRLCWVKDCITHNRHVTGLTVVKAMNLFTWWTDNSSEICATVCITNERSLLVTSQWDYLPCRLIRASGFWWDRRLRLWSWQYLWETPQLRCHLHHTADLIIQ